MSCNMPQYVTNQHTMQKSYTTLAHNAKEQNKNQNNSHHKLKNIYNKNNNTDALITIIDVNYLILLSLGNNNNEIIQLAV